MDANGIAYPKRRYLGFELFFLDGVDDAVRMPDGLLAAQAEISESGYGSGRSISADTGGTQVVARTGSLQNVGAATSAGTTAVGTRASTEARGRRSGRGVSRLPG